MQPQNIANKSNLNLTLDPVIEIDKECREREKKNLKINPLDKSSRKILISMLAIGLVACLFPANLAAFAFTNGQPANSVLGQSVFTTSFSLSSSAVNRPAGEAFDSAGNLWVVDAKYNRVLEYAAPFSNGEAATLVIGQSSFTTNTAATTATGLNSPQGLAFDSAGNLWVVDGDNNRVLEYLKGSGFTNGEAATLVIGQSSFTTNFAFMSAAGLDSPTTVAFDSSGNLWVADAGDSRVLEYLKGSGFTNGEAATTVLGQSSFTTDTRDTSATGLNVPISIAFDSAGNLWVADQNNERVVEYLKGSGFTNGEAATTVLGQSSFTTNTRDTSATGLQAPQGLAFDITGNLWVADDENNRILEYLKGSGFTNGEAATTVLGQSSFTTNGNDVSATGLNSPQGLAFDSTHNLWVADEFNNRVIMYPQASLGTNGAAATTVIGQSDFTTRVALVASATSEASPAALAYDSSGNLWVADSANNRVLMYPQASLGTNGAAATVELGQPSGTAFTSSTANNGGISASTLSSPAGLAFDTLGNLWVADSANNRVLMYPQASLGTNGAAATVELGQPSGTAFTSSTANNGGISASTLSSPSGLAFDTLGNLWVADSANNRVLMYSQASLGTNGAAATVELGQPSGTAFTSSTANNGGISATSLWRPVSTKFDSTHNLWVADDENNRVLMYPQASLGTNGAAATTVLGQSVFTSGSSSFETATSETEPNALTFDSSGNLWIVDGGPSRVLEYTTPFSNGQAATTVIGKSGFNIANCDITQDGGCFFRDGPTGISFDTTGNLWVADAGNNRVLQFLTSPSASTGVTASSASTSSITISWTASSGATSYTVYRSTSPSGPFTTSVGTSTTTSFIDSGLSKATTYYYEVTASNSGGDSPLSSPPASATTLAVFVPEFPLGIPIAIGVMSALYFVMRYKFGGMPKF